MFFRQMKKRFDSTFWVDFRNFKQNFISHTLSSSKTVLIIRHVLLICNLAPLPKVFLDLRSWPENICQLNDLNINKKSCTILVFAKKLARISVMDRNPGYVSYLKGFWKHEIDGQCLLYDFGQSRSTIQKYCKIDLSAIVINLPI